MQRRDSEEEGGTRLIGSEEAKKNKCKRGTQEKEASKAKESGIMRDVDFRERTFSCGWSLSSAPSSSTHHCPPLSFSSARSLTWLVSLAPDQLKRHSHERTHHHHPHTLMRWP